MSRVAEPPAFVTDGVNSEERQPVAGRAVDYDLHGIVRTRLLDATPADEAVVARQLGPLRTTAEGEPDITIRFVDALRTPSPVRLLGVNDVGFTDDAYLVLRSTHKTAARVQIDMEHIGGRCEIVCERGLQAVPLLIAIVNLTALRKGFVALHASGFNYGGKGVLLCGWAKSGKTEALLSFMARGASYVGDEWIYLPASGDVMYGIPEPIRLWRWHLQQMPQFERALGRKARRRMRMLAAAVRSFEALGASPVTPRPLRKDFRRAASAVGRQLNVQIPPAKLFGSDAVALSGAPDMMFLLVSREHAGVEVTEVEPQEIAARMLFSNQIEQADLMSHYWKFRYAFPERSNALLENAPALQAEILQQALAGKPAYTVYHPHPVNIEGLYDVMRPALGSVSA